MAEIHKVIGLMSGTSLDGIDAALLDTDGEAVAVPGPALTLPFEAQTRGLLRAAMEVAGTAGQDEAAMALIRKAERKATDAHAEAVQRLLDKAGLRPADISLIGLHGQTILHRPEARLTWQIGDGARLARTVGIDVVNDFRTADVRAGGEGAPLVPLYHAALVREAAGIAPPVAVVNIGGVANVTWVGPKPDNGDILAFDTGPGNAPIDDWTRRHTGAALDESGRLARKGRIDHAALDAMLADAFFERAPPKSLDRMDFGTARVAHLSPADGAATLTAFTAAAIARAREHFPEPVTQWVICGGGRHNPVLMEALRARVNAPVLCAEELGWRGDFLEAEAFAYLAERARRGLPLSLPTTTGVAKPMTGGRLHRWKTA